MDNTDGLYEYGVAGELDDDYERRSADTLAYRLMMHLKAMEILDVYDIRALRSPPWPKIEEAEREQSK